jgi:hypothetical protein
MRELNQVSQKWWQFLSDTNILRYTEIETRTSSDIQE